MAKRSNSQFKADDAAYPVRVKFRVPIGGMRTLPIDPHVWLRENLGNADWAWGPAPTIGVQATAYFFRKVEDAQRFVDAFPELALADGVARDYGVREPRRQPHEVAHAIGSGWKRPSEG